MIHDTTQQLNGATAVQYPAESGHWYDPKTGSQVELPPRTWAKTAIKKGLVPGVTSITKLVASPALSRWKINRAILLTCEVLEVDPDEALLDDDYVIQSVWDKLEAESEAITGRGKELHAAIEQYAAGRDDFSGKWIRHLQSVNESLEVMGIDLTKGSSEHSFATERYGGKVDWHNDTWLLDFKTKDRLSAPQGGVKKLAYPEHAQQLAAYYRGLWPFSTAKERRVANVFVGVEDAAVHVHPWKPEELNKGWRKFSILCDYWWEDKQP